MDNKNPGRVPYFATLPIFIISLIFAVHFNWGWAALVIWHVSILGFGKIKPLSISSTKRHRQENTCMVKIYKVVQIKSNTKKHLNRE